MSDKAIEWRDRLPTPAEVLAVDPGESVWRVRNDTGTQWTYSLQVVDGKIRLGVLQGGQRVKALPPGSTITPCTHVGDEHQTIDGVEVHRAIYEPIPWPVV